MYGFNFDAFINAPEAYDIHDEEFCIICYDDSILKSIVDFIYHTHGIELKSHDFMAIGGIVYPAAIEITKDISKDIVNKIKILRDYALYNNSITDRMKRDLIKIARRKQAEIIGMM